MIDRHDEKTIAMFERVDMLLVICDLELLPNKVKIQEYRVKNLVPKKKSHIHEGRLPHISRLAIGVG